MKEKKDREYIYYTGFRDIIKLYQKKVENERLPWIFSTHIKNKFNKKQ